MSRRTFDQLQNHPPCYPPSPGSYGGTGHGGYHADRDKYEVAIRSLGRLDGQDPPWVTVGGNAGK